MIRHDRRHAIALMACTATTPAWSQSTGSKAVEWIVPYAPGGAADIVSRIVAKRFGEITGQSVAVVNRPGAASLLATEMFARAKPDGLSILTASGSALTIHPETNKKLRFDPDADFDPLCGLMKLSQILIVRPELDVRSVADLTAYVKARKGDSTFSSVGVGSPNHLSGELYLSMIEATARHVAYNGTPASLADIAAGRVDFSVTDLASSAAFVKDGRVKALAVPDDRRHWMYPDLPTMQESGVPLIAYSWFGVTLPRGVPSEARERVLNGTTAALADPRVRAAIQNYGAQVLDIPEPGKFREFIQLERKRWAAIVRERGISTE